jgi:hypothetical protein
MKFFIVPICIALFLWSCKCQHIECESGPATIDFSIIDSTGVSVLPLLPFDTRSVVFRNINSPNTQLLIDGDTIASFALDKGTERYILSLGGIVIDTFQITVIENKGECCSSFTISEVGQSGEIVPFRPFVVVRM